MDEAATLGLMRRGRDGKARRTVAGLRAALWWRRRITPAPRRLGFRRLNAWNGWPLTRPLDIWSSSGDAWHLVPTAALRRPIWGAVWNLVLIALAAAGAFTVDLAAPVPHRAIVGAGLGVLTLAATGLWLPAGRKVRSVPTDAVFRGTVICHFANSWWDEENMISHDCYHCSVEDPATRQAWTFQYGEIQRSIFGRPSSDERFQVGEVVEIRCNPRRRVLHRMERAA